MLAVTGRVGDGWVCPLNIYVSPEQAAQSQALIDAAAQRAGREPPQIRRIYNVLGAIGSFRGGQGLVGPADEWITRLSDWAVRIGFDTFIFWPTAEPEQQVRIFADEVVPAVRARVSELRGRGDQTVRDGP